MALAFSSSDKDVIKKEISFKENKLIGSEDFNIVYEIDRSVDWIKINGFKKVALQFPDDLLKDSCQVALNLQKLTESNIFILADTSYGSCCVDEIAAEHVSAEAIIHYGHSCLSPTTRLPVLYVFCNVPIDVTHACQEFRRLIYNVNSYVVIFYDTLYAVAADDFVEELEEGYKNIIKSKLMIPTQENGASETVHTDNSDMIREETVICKCRRNFTLPNNVNLENCEMFYIGSEGPTLTNLMMSFNTSRFYSYDPNTLLGRQESVNINQALRKRYYFIERAKDAQMVGILVGTLGVTKYLTVIKHLKELISKAGKRAYVLVVGKINVTKLANFPEVDVFVLVACSENSLIDSKEFYQPILTPFELEIAYNQARKWTGNYVTDFSDLLPGASHFIPYEENKETESEFSLISGKMRSIGVENISEQDESNMSLNMRNEKTTLATLHSQAAGEYLMNRSWRGLEQKLGETPVVKAVEGSTGIAASYEGEGK